VILIAGYALFGEVVTPAKIAGVGIIVFGVILMSLDGKPHV
jgi:drug/metabolite transporter (DMT)-like permease